MRRRQHAVGILCVAVAVLALFSLTARPEVILQYFNTSWRELAYKMPELAEVGYGAIWIPPPTKASGGLSVGYDLVDPFDLGGKDQRGTVRTRFGTEAELLRLIETAHRFGIRVYCDNIMNHRAFDVPGYNDTTPVDVYPGMLPEDFHLRVTEEGFYRKWDNVANWGDTWEIQYRNFSDLIDIAQEMPDNGNFGTTERSHLPKIRFVRHPNNPELYYWHPALGYVGFYSTNITAALLTDPANAWLYEEDVGGYLIRAVRWLVDRTKVDGLRLDAVKHVPSEFFGQQWGDKDPSTAGYCGQAQDQFDKTRNYSDTNNLRDTVFETEASFGRNDLMMFGEHLGEPPSFSDYIDAGMRLVDSQLHGHLNGVLGNPWAGLWGLDVEGAGGMGGMSSWGVTYAKSHDDDYATRPELHYAFELTRKGLPNIYTDGNYQSETLAQSGGAFPRHANTCFLGQWNDNRIPNLVYINAHFARGEQVARGADGDVVAFERRDWREGGISDSADACTLFFAMNDNYDAGQYREFDTSFRVGDYLWQYSSAGGGYYYTVPSDRKIKCTVPPGGYFAFSWRSPEESDTWQDSALHPVMIYENGQPVGWTSYVRRDGPDGDPGFNPYGVYDSNTTDYSYTYWVPRVTSAANLSFVARVDGSAENVLLKLDGGINLNDVSGPGGTRDYPPGNDGSTEVFEGYEQMQFVRRIREKFAATNVSRNVIGSPGCETYEADIGSSGFNINFGSGVNTSDGTALWVYHDPWATNAPGGGLQFSPAPLLAVGSNLTVWTKIGHQYDWDKAYIYYTTNGTTYPEGSEGIGLGDTKVAEMQWHSNSYDTNGSVVTNDWVKGEIPALGSGTKLRYKVGVFRDDSSSVFPISADYVALKKKMLTKFEVTNFNASTVEYYPHIDWGVTTTGLVEGFHVLRARPFLKRDAPKGASIYNTFVQPFYFDASAPTGQVLYPSESETLGGNRYGAVVRTDPTVDAVWYHIEDANAANDDAQTGRNNGNGTNAAGQAAWVRATEVTPTLSLTNAFPAACALYPLEWRFDYINIPTSSAATIYVKLAELSSSTNPLDSDAVGHFATLQRNVTANGPPYDMFVAWPQHDGDTVGQPYEMKVYFSTALADGVSSNDLKNRFLILINTNAQGKDQYNILYSSIEGKYHELAYTLPDLYNGDDNFLHEIEVIHTNAHGDGITLYADRYVKAQPTEAEVHVDIISPPEYDSDGKAYEIVLPDVASPAATQRQYTIRVETDLSVKDVRIAFTNSAGTAVPYPRTTSMLGGVVSAALGFTAVTGYETNLAGTVAVNNGGTAVTGTGTAFSDAVAAGNVLRISTNLVTVTQVVSQTSLLLAAGYPGTNESAAVAASMPGFDSELSVGTLLRVDSNVVQVSQVLSGSNLVVGSAYTGSSVSRVKGYRLDGNPTVSGTRQYWSFLWTNMTEGYFAFLAEVDTNYDFGTIEAYAIRNTRVLFREIVATDTNDADDDDDGLYDGPETTPTNVPAGNSEDWNNGQIHIYHIYGRTDPLRPDTDGDGLPDGLESGWRVAAGQTATNVDTDGDGWMNFCADLDPPFYNTLDNHTDGGNACTVPGVKSRNEGGDRALQAAGSVTDPSNPDTDYDGLPDGIEDANRNGWVDGDGDLLGPSQDECDPRNWPNGVMDGGETWTETDPNKSDSDGDGASDGYGEDVNANGRIDGDSNSNRVWESGELWTETDPLNDDTDGDGLRDGWERQYSFDPLDDGIVGHTNMGTGGIIATNLNGAGGNPDDDTIIEGGLTNAYTNLKEYQNGTNPRVPDTGTTPTGAIFVGRGEAIGDLTGTGTNYEEFTDWTWEDCLILDEYEGDGYNNQGGDVYMGWDGFDSSRDIVAFYVHDGGDTGASGDGRFYFRVDFQDLLAQAEEGNLDIYVVIDIGNTAEGEFALPDEVDTGTSNRWEAVVAVYQSGIGAVYVDTNHAANTTAIGQTLDGSVGVSLRDQSTADGFIDAYFSSDLDACEFSISRQALRDAGWNGLSTTGFHFQVFTTKDGTQNDPVGAGDIGGRNDVRDSIYDDDIAEDWWLSQQSIKNVLGWWFGGNQRASRADVAMVVHGNQPILPGSAIQSNINTAGGAGYHRPLGVHELYAQPLNLHITPTLASAMEWAKTDPGAEEWRKGRTANGPLFNDWIADLVSSNIVFLLGSTFSDHILQYFPEDFNRTNAALASEFLNEIYGFTPSSNTVFWAPERVLDRGAFSKITNMGYRYTLLDQMTHLFFWCGRSTALGDGGYKLNRFDSVNCFVMNDGASSYRFQNTDGGLPITLRSLLNRKARSGTQDQVVTMLSNWEDFTDYDDATAYDRNIRWIANHPWIRIVGLEQIANNQVDTSGDGAGDAWWVEDRSWVTPTNKIASDWLHHATEENYDNWYCGSAYEESLSNKVFDIRPGSPVPKVYGMVYWSGMIRDAWDQVTGIADGRLARLAQAALQASVFETAFHHQTNDNGTARYSNGDYIYPDTTFQNLTWFSKEAQAQSRMAAIYRRVDQWVGEAQAGWYDSSSVASNADVDLDGEVEYLLFNDRLFALFESLGGRMIAAWVRDILNDDVRQAAGNLVGYAGSETELEGTNRIEAATKAIGAYRTSVLKDWWASANANRYINDLYTMQNWTNGWRMTSSDTNIRKTVTLDPKAWSLEVDYQMSGAMLGQTLYVRHGLSPDLYNLLVRGQETLAGESHAAGVMTLRNTNYEETVSAIIGYGGDGTHTVGFNTTAEDDDEGLGVTNHTVNMRNQAQTHQVELVGTNSFTFSIGFEVVPSDWDGDGMPNAYEDANGFDALNPADAAQDADGDGVPNGDEYVALTDPNPPGGASDYPRLTAVQSAGTGVVVRFDTELRRRYFVYYDNTSLANPAWTLATTSGLAGTGSIYEWPDDGSQTEPDPAQNTNRFYKIKVGLPE